jgi:hypothetical protein
VRGVCAARRSGRAGAARAGTAADGWRGQFASLASCNRMGISGKTAVGLAASRPVCRVRVGAARLAPDTKPHYAMRIGLR